MEQRILLCNVLSLSELYNVAKDAASLHDDQLYLSHVLPRHNKAAKVCP